MGTSGAWRGIRRRRPPEPKPLHGRHSPHAQTHASQTQPRRNDQPSQDSRARDQRADRVPASFPLSPSLPRVAAEKSLGALLAPPQQVEHASGRPSCAVELRTRSPPRSTAVQLAHSAAHVIGPMTPSTDSPCLAWNPRIAVASVALVEPVGNPRVLSLPRTQGVRASDDDAT